MSTAVSKPMTELTPELMAELIRLRAENEALKTKGGYKLSLKISNKGAVSMYGLGRFPVTLYPEQWLAVLETSEKVKAFLATNESAIKERLANPIVAPTKEG